VWPFDLALLERRRSIVVAGRSSAALWSGGPAGFHCAGTAPIGFEGARQTPSLGSALQQLLESARARPGGGAVHLVLESAWLPVLALDVGSTPWAERKLQALLAHRLGMLYGTEPAARDWGLQVDHRAGDAVVLGFGLAKEVKDAVLSAGKAAGITLASIQPAFAWGMDHGFPKAGRAQAGWCLWGEQDRTLVAQVQRGRVTALNPAAAPVRGAEACRTLVQREALRFGSEQAGAPVWVGGWHAATADADANAFGVRFFGLQRASTAAASAASGRPAQGLQA
jgi:hypothetical protein